MAKMQKPKSVEDFISQYPDWQEELVQLREIILQTDLDEGIKWAFPTYMDHGKNIVSIMAAKAYCSIWFHQGATLTDELGLLTNAQEDKTKAMRQMRFAKTQKFDAEVIHQYIFEAVENERSGNIIKPEKKPLIIPSELENLFEESGLHRLAFEQYNLTKKREICEYVGSAKRESTRQTRLEKVKPMILAGTSPGDKYRK